MFIRILMTAGTMSLDAGAVPAVAATIAFTAFSLFAVVNSHSCRNETLIAFNRDVLNNRNQLMLYGVVLRFIFLPTELNFLAGCHGPKPRSLATSGFSASASPFASLLVNEVIKDFLREPTEARRSNSCYTRDSPGVSTRAVKLISSSPPWGTSLIKDGSFVQFRPDVE